MRAFYAPFQRNRDRIFVMDVRSAELTKYAANAMLATRISFMNELALPGRARGRRHRAGAPGHRLRSAHRLPLPVRRRGYGGSCFPKDVKALIRTAAAAGVPAAHAARPSRRSTTRRSRCWSKRSSRRFGDDLGGKRFAMWGLAFKPNTDDMREAPSRRVLIGELLARGATRHGLRPGGDDRGAARAAGDEPRIALRRQRRTPRSRAPTRWSSSPSGRSSAAPTSTRIARSLKTPVIFDGRNLYDPKAMAAFGLEYHCIGRPSVMPSPT